MDGIQHQDPFLWDVDTVIERLCHTPCSWSRDPAALARTIQDEEIDGKTLLTYEHLCSRQELMECLGIKLARHKASLGEAIIDLRATSQAYQQWNRELKRKQADDLDNSQPNKRHRQTTPSYEATFATGQNERNGTSTKSKESPRGHNLLEGALNPPPSESATPVSASEPSKAKEGASGPPKPKRLAPLHLGTKPVSVSAAFLPTEADTIGYPGKTGKPAVNNALPWESASSHAYLGEGSLPIDAIQSSNKPLSTRLLRRGKDDFATIVPNMLPRGRRQVVYRAMLKFLKVNSQREALWRQGLVPMGSPSPSESDSIIDLFDLPDSLDEETLQEIAAEKLENEIMLPERQLTREQVQGVLDASIRNMSLQWEETKLLKHKRKAYKTWTDARRRGNKLKLIVDARRQAKFYDDRIKKLCAAIVDEKWFKEAEVKNQARCLEQNIEDKLHQLWLVDMLGSRTEPQKPHDLPAPRRRENKRSENVLGDEILTSSDEDDFIVPEDEGAAVHGEVSFDSIQEYRDDPTPIKSESPRPVGQAQTGLPTPTRKNKGPIVIDLTTPTKLKSVLTSSPIVVDSDGPMVPSNEEFESFEGIGEKPPRHWVKASDRWRLLICLMSQLPHARRMAVLRLVQTKSWKEAWLLSVHLQLEDPVIDPSLLDISEPRLTAFDLTRVFLSLTQLSHYKETRIGNLQKKDKRRLNETKSEWFPTFCRFLRNIASRFPQESQIYRAEIFDDDLEGNDDTEDVPESQNEPSQSRRAPTREIVRDRDAVDLRQRERERVEEQERRRLKLRATLATANDMSRDKSRLIINESKNDDQGFIYINDEIAKSIQDHQIDGVRFLWNQIVQDVDTRQGCLLAHTMGLGKTMQVITFLAALQEAALSSDQSVLAQIPQDLRESKTLVLCPAGLVENWMDELLMWAPMGLLGDLRKIGSNLTLPERSAAIRGWANEGGVLVIGYNMFKRVLAQDDQMEALLTNSAHIVVADEAHMLKNPDSQVTQVCSRFRTMSRIALTGSPLANNVEEYHTMINWVAPNFLGPLSEFREIYANPIHTGLWTDSLGSEKRRALKMLQVLKETVAPKVDRATIRSIKGGLPPKYEFVISVPPTKMQDKLYELYVQGLQNDFGGSVRQAQVFNLVHDLGLICNHPNCFRQKVKEVQAALHKGEDVTFPRSIITNAMRQTNDPDPNSPSLSLKVGLLMVILAESQRCGDKVLVFSQSIPTLDYLSNLLTMQKRSFCRLDGDTKIAKRQNMVKDFNNGTNQVYLISTTAGGVGLNIQGANRVVIFDSKWNPVSDQQAIGRAYRIGQKKPVHVYRLLVAGSFEDDMHNKAVFKMQLSSRVVDKKNPVSWSKRMSSLMHHLKPAQPEDLSQFTGRDSILDKLVSFKQDGKGILRIVSSDSFEEEDPTVALTAEERQDAENMVTRNRIRLTNPEEYERLVRKEEQEQRDRINQIIHQSHDQPSPMAAPSLAETAPAQATPVPVRAEGTNGTDNLASRPLAPTSADPPPAVPLPMVGANTFFGKPPVQSSAPPQSSASPATIAPTQATKGSPVQAQLFGQPMNPHQARTDFEETLASQLSSLGNAKHAGLTEYPVMIAQNATSAIAEVQQAQQHGILPDTQQWRILKDLLCHQRFVLHIAAGSLSPTFLALTGKTELNKRIQILNDMSEKEFDEQLSRARKPDPHV